MLARVTTANEAWCAPCGQMHPLTAFGRDRYSANKLAYACKAVIAERNRRSHAKARDRNNRRHAEARERYRASPDAQTWALKKLLSEATRRARAKGLALDISLGDLRAMAQEVCPVLGLRLVYQARSRRGPASASLDRIDSAKGYTLGNVWIISWRANHLKSDATVGELRQLVAALETRSGRLLDGVLHDAMPEAR